MRFRLLLGALVSAIAAHAAGILADYASPVLDANRRVDAAATLDRVAGLHANTYFVLIHSVSDWERLKNEFLPAAVTRGLDIWTYFVPPSECPDSCKLPFDKDYIRIAAGVAELSLKYPNLKGLAIDDFMDNTKLYTPEYVGRMRAAGRAINPKFQFLPLLYWRSMTSAVLDQYDTVIDGVIFAYRDEPTVNTHRAASLRTQLTQAETMLQTRGKSLILMIYCAPLGRIPIPPGADYVANAATMAVNDIAASKLTGVVTYKLGKSGPAPDDENYSRSGNGRATFLASGPNLKAGDYAELSTPIVGAEASSGLSFWRTALYARLQPGYLYLQVMADDRLAWEQDVANFESRVWKQEHLDAAVAGKTLRFRLAVKKNTGSMTVLAGIDDVEGAAVADPGFENAAAWTTSTTTPALMPMVQTFDPQRPVRMYAGVRSAYAAQNPASFTLSGNWDVRVNLPGTGAQTVRVNPPAMVTVVGEEYKAVPVFNPKANGWVKGVQLRGVKTQETTSPHLLDAASFVLRAGPEPDAVQFTKGVDYEIDQDWGTFGRLSDGRIKSDQAVYASYRHAQMRLDAVVLTADDRVILRQGEPRSSAPLPPQANAGERFLGNIYLPGSIAKLEAEHLFPVLEHVYPEPPKTNNAAVSRLVRRLESGQSLRILAWGDSVTDGAYLADRATQRWQEQFATRLRERFPKAHIELITQAWGGRNTGSYLAEPPGSPHNYRETVLAAKPDLIISEFVNDASLKPAQVEERYTKLLADFQSIGAEWIIFTPHYVRPDWMGLTRERDIDNDPRPYVEGLRAFAATHDVALADASLRWGRLWRQGIPYSTLLVNAINHPDVRGMRIFADTLMALFQ
jgi:lysophospholipase L1-like esterase